MYVLYVHMLERKGGGTYHIIVRDLFIRQERPPRCGGGITTHAPAPADVVEKHLVLIPACPLCLHTYVTMYVCMYVLYNK